MYWQCILEYYANRLDVQGLKLVQLLIFAFHPSCSLIEQALLLNLQNHINRILTLSSVIAFIKLGVALLIVLIWIINFLRITLETALLLVICFMLVYIKRTIIIILLNLLFLPFFVLIWNFPICFIFNLLFFVRNLVMCILRFLLLNFWLFWRILV